MRTLIFVSALLLLGACAIAENPNVTAARTICASAYGDPALNPIRDRIPLDDNQAAKASMALLADQGKPNAAERAALQQYDAANRRCWDAWDKAGISPIIQQARSTVSSALAELHSGSTSYGEFNRRRATAIAEMQARLREAEDRERAYRESYYHHRSMFCDPWGRPRYRTYNCF